MKLPHENRRQGRTAFTLVELIVVISLILILAGLLTVAVAAALRKARVVQNRTDISQLEVALEQFKQQFHLGQYPPSRIKLAFQLNSTNYPGASTPGNIDYDSVQFITMLFPRCQAVWSSAGIDWTGVSQAYASAGVTVAPPPGPYILEGDQCLAFFLGGIPGPSKAWDTMLFPNGPSYFPNTPPSFLGFSANPQNPGDTSSNRLGPYFDFVSGRLVAIPSTSRSAFHYSYLDTYGTSDGFGTLVTGLPYAFFSSYNATNGYNRYYSATSPSSDCATLGVWPYVEIAPPSIRYQKPSSFQIVSGGADLTFGPGSDPTQPTLLTWTSATAPTVYPPGTPGNDDQANFTPQTLGTGQ